MADREVRTFASCPSVQWHGGIPSLKIDQPIGKFLAQPIRAHTSQRFPAYDVSHRQRLRPILKNMTGGALVGNT
jgi:hypothetical protein